jgi:site-specific DNA-methyltransferase (adenine-specific)
MFLDSIPAEYRNTLVQMDALAFLRSLPDASVPLYLFSPPYNLGISSGAGMRSYGHYATDAGMKQRGGSGKWSNAAIADGYAAHDDAMPPAAYKTWQQEILSECWRTLTENGLCITPLDFNPGRAVRQIVIWARAGGFNWNPTYYCPTHEWIVIFAKSGFRLRDRGASVAGDVWAIPQEISTWHPAPFPLALAQRVIETTMPDFVCDPFCGSGTTAVAARQCGVDFIGCDLSADYVARANERIARTRRMTLRQASLVEAAEQEVLW